MAVVKTDVEGGDKAVGTFPKGQVLESVAAPKKQESVSTHVESVATPKESLATPKGQESVATHVDDIHR